MSRMPAFHYPNKKVKSQDDINEAKNRNNLLKGGGLEESKCAALSCDKSSPPESEANDSKSNTAVCIFN